MKNNIKMLTKQDPKIIRKELLINGGDMDLYLDIFLTDKEGTEKQIITKKADSILANFMRMLYLQMGRDIRNNAMGTFYRVIDTKVGSQITSITNNGSGLVRISITNAFTSYPDSGKIALGGFQGVSFDGTYDFTKVSNSSIDLVDSTYSAGWTAGTGGFTAFTALTSLGTTPIDAFLNNGIIVGLGDTPVLIDDQTLEKPIQNGSASGQLTHGTSTVAQDTNNSDSAQITFTRTFTNNSNTTLAVKEIGYYAYFNGNVYLIMRDILPSEVNVAQGVTLTVNYRIRTLLDTGTDPGGFLASFMRLLYRQASGNTRAIFDVDNVSRTTGPNGSSFCTVQCGGFNVESPPASESQQGYRYGIVVGRGESAVAMGDYYLETPIAHGKGANEMLYYGGFAEDFIIGDNYAEFTITKAMENASGNSIEVKEYILTGASGNASSGTGAYQMTYVYTLTRNVLTSPVTVENGEFLKVSYTLRCIVGGASS